MRLGATPALHVRHVSSKIAFLSSSATFPENIEVSNDFPPPNMNALIKIQTKQRQRSTDKIQTKKHTSSPPMPLLLQVSVMLRYASSKLVAMKSGSYFWKTEEIIY